MIYRTLHRWVEKELGRPDECSKCGLNDASRRYQWANLSGEYKEELTDWVRLCIPCHKVFDLSKRKRNGDVCTKGHPYSAENTRTRINRLGNEERICRTCQAAYAVKFHNKKKVEIT